MFFKIVLFHYVNLVRQETKFAKNSLYRWVYCMSARNWTTCNGEYTILLKYYPHGRSLVVFGLVFVLADLIHFPQGSIMWFFIAHKTTLIEMGQVDNMIPIRILLYNHSKAKYICHYFMG